MESLMILIWKRSLKKLNTLILSLLPGQKIVRMGEIDEVFLERIVAKKDGMCACILEDIDAE